MEKCCLLSEVTGQSGFFTQRLHRLRRILGVSTKCNCENTRSAKVKLSSAQLLDTGEVLVAGSYSATDNAASGEKSNHCRRLECCKQRRCWRLGASCWSGGTDEPFGLPLNSADCSRADPETRAIQTVLNCSVTRLEWWLRTTAQSAPTSPSPFPHPRSTGCRSSNGCNCESAGSAKKSAPARC